MQRTSIRICLLVLSLTLASCASPTPAQPVATSIAVPTSTSTLTETPTPTAIPTATATATRYPTPTPPIQTVDKYGFVQFGLLKVKVASDSFYQEKYVVLNTAKYPDAQKIIDRAILAAFALLRSGSLADPIAQAKQLQADIARGKGKFMIWAWHATPDGLVDNRYPGKASHLLIDPAKGIQLTFTTNKWADRYGFGGWLNTGWDHGVTDDGQLVIVSMINEPFYKMASGWYSQGIDSLESSVRSGLFPQMFINMMMGGQGHYQNGLSEGWPPQLVGPGGYDARPWDRVRWTVSSLSPFDLLNVPVIPMAIDATRPTPTPPSRPVPTPDPRLEFVIGRGQLVPTVNGLQAGSNTFTLSLQNKNPNETFNISSVYGLIVTDAISGSVAYEFDNAEMFDAGFAKSIDAGQTITITYVLKSPINSNAKVVNFKLPNIGFIYYLNPLPPGDLGRGEIVTQVASQALELPDLTWQETLP